MSTRDDKQKEVVDLYLKANLNRCSLVLGTGFGKSKVVIDILKAIKPRHTLILVNSTDLRDNTWKKEFEKFGLADIYNRSVSTCTYQLAHRLGLNEVCEPDTFIIADEVDFAANTDEYAKFFSTHDEHRILGVTGFITEKKREWFEDNLPILYKYTTEEAQNDNILNKIHFKFVKFDLSRDKSYEIEYSKNGEKSSFITSENDAYSYSQKNVLKMLAIQATVRRNNEKLNQQDYEEAVDKADQQVLWALAKRNKVLLRLDSSAKIAKRIVEEELKSDESKKVIIFSVYTEQSEKISENVYNGKNNSKKNEKSFDAFNNSEIRSLAVCSKVNRGVNFVGLNVAVMETFFGSDTDMNQRLGRLTRLDKDDIAIAYILLPYYREKNENDVYELVPTQQVSWARKALQGLKNVKGRSTVIDLIYH